MSKERKAKTQKKIKNNAICDMIVKEMLEKEKELLDVRPAIPLIVPHDISEAPDQVDLFDYPTNSVHQYKVHSAVCAQFEGLMDICVRYDEIVKLWGIKELGDIDGKKFFEAVKLVMFTPGNIQGLASKFLRDYEATAESVNAKIVEHNARVQELLDAESNEVKEGE